MSLQGVARPQVSSLEGGEKALGLHEFFCQATSDTGCLSVINHWRWTAPSLDGAVYLFLVYVCLHIVSAPTAGHFAVQRHRVCMYVKCRSLVTAPRTKSDQTATQGRRENSTRVSIIVTTRSEALPCHEAVTRTASKE